jgi:hypothetical protein
VTIRTQIVYGKLCPILNIVREKLKQTLRINEIILTAFVSIAVHAAILYSLSGSEKVSTDKKSNLTIDTNKKLNQSYQTIRIRYTTEKNQKSTSKPKALRSPKKTFEMYRNDARQGTNTPEEKTTNDTKSKSMLISTPKQHKSDKNSGLFNKSMIQTKPILKKESLRISYTEKASNSFLETTVFVDVLVDKKGHVVRAKLRKRVGYGMDEVILKSITRAAFYPAKSSLGANIQSWTNIRIILVME